MPLTNLTIQDYGAVIDLAPVLDTLIYADGDVLFATTQVPNAVPSSGGLVMLESVHVLDEDDLGIGFDLVFMRSNVALGVFNVAPAISDVNGREIVGMAKILAADYTDLGGCRVAQVGNIRRLMKAADGARDLYVGGIVRGGTPTYTASGLKLKFGFAW